MKVKTLEELSKAGFRKVKGTPEILYAKTDGKRTIVYQLTGYVRVYDGETKYIEGLLKEGLEE